MSTRFATPALTLTSEGPQATLAPSLMTAGMVGCAAGPRRGSTDPAGLGIMHVRFPHPELPKVNGETAIYSLTANQARLGQYPGGRLLVGFERILADGSAPLRGTSGEVYDRYTFTGPGGFVDVCRLRFLKLDGTPLQVPWFEIYVGAIDDTTSSAAFGLGLRGQLLGQAPLTTVGFSWRRVSLTGSTATAYSAVASAWSRRYDLHTTGQKLSYQRGYDTGGGTGWPQQVTRSSAPGGRDVYSNFDGAGFVKRLALSPTTIETSVRPLPAEPTYRWSRSAYDAAEWYPLNDETGAYLLPIDPAEVAERQRAGFTWQFRGYPAALGNGAAAYPRPVSMNAVRITCPVRISATSRSSYMSFGSANSTYPKYPSVFEVNARIFAQHNPPATASRSDTAGAYVSAAVTLRSNGSAPELDGTYNDPTIAATLTLDLPDGVDVPKRIGIVTDILEGGPPPIPPRPILIQPFSFEPERDADFGRTIQVHPPGYQGNGLLFQVSAIPRWPDYRWVPTEGTQPLSPTSPPSTLRALSGDGDTRFSLIR